MHDFRLNIQLAVALLSKVQSLLVIASVSFQLSTTQVAPNSLP